MSAKSELDIQQRTSSASLRKSYFALIPVFNWKGGREYRTERNIIKIIRKSDFCKSNPILKALLIENVRICCVVIESSGKQSGKILYASAPYILALVSKANPKLEKLLKSEKISSCLSLLRRSDLESLLSHAYQTTVIIHKGVKKLYPVSCVNLLRDSFLFSEKSVMYLLNLGLYVLQSCAEFLYDKVRPFIYYICHQNRELASYVADCLPQLIASSFRSSIVASARAKKAVIRIYQFVRKIVSYLYGVVNRVREDSSLKSTAKKISFYLQVCIAYLRSTGTCKRVERYLPHLLSVSKPYIVMYFQKTFAVVKDLIRVYMPSLIDNIQYFFKELVDVLKKLIEDNSENILNACNSLKIFLSENRHRITSVCCLACRFCYSSVTYLFNAFQVILPHIIQFSSDGIITFIICSNIVWDYCVYLCKLAYRYKTIIFESHKELLCRMASSFISIFKSIYKVVIKMQPYTVLIFRIALSELTKLTHVLAPTSLACLQEMNSSLFHASKEVVSKSSLAVKRILPSFYYALKAVVPPTFQAAHEVIKSSTKSVVIVYPAVFRCALTICPELEEGMIVLLTDGNRACLEVMSVTFSASCEMKDAALTVSSNLPVVFRAFREVLTTTSHAAVEVSLTSVSAKTRVFKDVKRAHDVVHTSFLLAEQEVVAMYMDAVFELNAILSNTPQNYLISDGSSFIKKYVVNFLYNQFEKSVTAMGGISKLPVNLTANIIGNAALCLRDFIKVVVYVYSCIVPIAYSVISNILPQKVCEDLSASISNSISHVCVIAKYNATYHIENLCSNMLSTLSDVNSKLVRSICDSLCKVWHAVKFSTQTLWDSACHFAPQAWTMFEYLASVFWDYLAENVPVLWKAWKRFCSAMWKLTNDLAPHVWQYSCSMAPVLWSSVRVLVKNFWSYVVDSSRFMWQHITFISSEYWMLSNTYVPCVWFSGCAETKKGWNVSCCLIENCWTFSVETCLLSWKFLHHSVAKSWKSGIAFTKTAYCVLTTSSLVLQKGFCLCRESKNRVCVIFKATPRISELSGTMKECYPESGAADNTSPRQLPFSFSLNNFVFSMVNFFPKVDKLLNLEAFIPSKIFRGNSWKLAVC